MVAFKLPDSIKFNLDCREISEYCWLKKIPPGLVLSHIREYVDKKISQMNLGPGKARDNLVNFLIENEYRFSLDDHIFLLSKRIDNREVEIDTNDDEVQIRALQLEHSSKWGNDAEQAEDSFSFTPEIDKPVENGGVTRLMIAAQSGDLDEVIRLVEIEDADPLIRCNSKMTAYQRSLDLGHFDVVDYLVRFEVITDNMAEAV